MPVPKPVKDEDKNKFMSRCIGFMHGENNKKPDGQKWTRDQMTAICFSQWEKKGKTKADIAEEERESDEEFVKKFLQKHPEYKVYFETEETEK